jgi:hypothetical protein
MFNLKFDLDSGNMDVDTWIREEDGLIDKQEEWVPPQMFSWLKSPYCNGSEKMTDDQKAAFYSSSSIFVP